MHLLSTCTKAFASHMRVVGTWHPDYNAASNISPDKMSLIDFLTAVIGASCSDGDGTDTVSVTSVFIHFGFTGESALGCFMDC